MKNILFIIPLFFILSCNMNKETKSNVFVESIKYNEFSDYRSKQPTLEIKIKVEDSIILKKIQSGEVKNLIIFLRKKHKKTVVNCQVSKIPLKKGKTFSFLFWTNSFLALNSDGKHYRENEDSYNITNILSGDVELVFDDETIQAGSCKDKTIIIQMIKN